MGGMPHWVSFIPSGIAVAEAAFSPSDLEPALWLASDEGVYADAGTTLAVDDDPVRQWQDQSGNDRHANQATLGSRPLFKTNILNGKPVIRFDGVDDFLTVTSLYGLSQAGFDVYVVARFRTTPSSSRTIIATGESGGEYGSSEDWMILRSFLDGTAKWACRINTGPMFDAVDGAVDDEAHVFDFGYTGSTRQRIGVDGSETVNTASIPTSVNLDGVFEVGALLDGATQASAIDVAEILAFGEELQIADKATLRNYLATKYGLTLA